MKHQYYGDVNDYRKYGLLRAIVRSGLRVGVLWMLTEDDPSEDGSLTGYLADPRGWRAHDPELFDALAASVLIRRHLDHVRDLSLLPGAEFVEVPVPTHRDARDTFFSGACGHLRDCDLVFVDPDNGIEVRSHPPGTKRSKKYVLWSEIERLYGAGHSVLIYQHFQHVERTSFIESLVNELRRRLSPSLVDCFRTPNVAFLLAGQPKHLDAIEEAAAHVATTWSGQIQRVARTTDTAGAA